MTYKMKTESDINYLLFNDIDTFKKLCRICLTVKSDGYILSVFSQQLLDKILLCTRIEMDKFDEFPSVICELCIEELNQAYNFRLKCENANSVLKDVIQNRKEIKIKSEERSKDVKNLELLSASCDKSTENVQCGETEKNNEEYELDDDHCEFPIEYSEENYSQFICSHCNKVYGEKTELNLHIKSQHPDTLKTIDKIKKKCRKESKAYKEKRKKRRMNRTLNKQPPKIKEFEKCFTVVDGPEKRYKCIECDYTNKNKYPVVYHYRCHINEKPFACDQCDQAYVSQDRLIRHKKVHSDKMEYMCAECGKQFKFREKFMRHKKVHSDEKEFVCTICSKGLKTNRTLRIHMDRHNGIKNHSCVTCGATFVSRAELLNHHMIHSTVRNYVCNLCDYKAYKKSSLDKHLRHHSGEKPFKCEECGVAYSTNGALNLHIRKHTNEMRYECKMCKEKFMYSVHLNKHMLRTHAIQFRWNDHADRRLIK